MPEPINGFFAFSLRTDLAGGTNFHCQIASDEGPAGLSVKVTDAEVTQAVMGGITPVHISRCTIGLSNDKDETLEIKMNGHTAPKRDGEHKQPFEASAFFRRFRPNPPPEELKGEGEFKVGTDENKPRDALLRRELKASGR